MATNLPIRPAMEALPASPRLPETDASWALAARGGRRESISCIAGGREFARLAGFVRRGLIAVAVATGMISFGLEDAAGQTPTPTPNSPPTVIDTAFDEISTPPGTTNYQIFLTNRFSDDDGIDTLTITARLLDDNVVEDPGGCHLNPMSDTSDLPTWLMPNTANPLILDAATVGPAGIYRFCVTATDGTDTVGDSFVLIVNTPPALVTSSQIQDKTLVVGDLGGEISLGDAFMDADGDDLEVVSVKIVNPNTITQLGWVGPECHDLDGDSAFIGLPEWLMLEDDPDSNPATFDAKLTIGTTVGEAGNDTVCVIVSDGKQQASDTFVLTVPTFELAVANPIGNQNSVAGRSEFMVSLAGVFADPNGADLTVEAELEDGSALPSWLAFDPDPDDDPATLDATLSLATGMRVGAADTYTIRVTAGDDADLDDPATKTASDEFDLVVAANATPMLANAIDDQDAIAGRAEFTVSLAGTFTDSADDSLTVTAGLLDANGTLGNLPAWLVVTGGATATPALELASGMAVGAADTYTIRVTATDLSNEPISDEFDLVVVDNSNPTVANAIGDRTTVAGRSVFAISLAGVFADDDDDVLTVTSELLDSRGTPVNPSWLVVVGGETPDPMLELASGMTVGAAGAYTIRVTATDPSGDTATDEIRLAVGRVNVGPVVANAIGDRKAVAGRPSLEISLEGVFTDSNHDDLTVTAEMLDSSGNPVVPPWLEVNGGMTAHPTLELVTATVVGAADTYTIRVTATDPDSAMATDEFDLVVAATNSDPTVANAIDDQRSVAGRPSFAVSLADVFEDANDDVLTVTAELMDSGGTPVTPSWLEVAGGATLAPTLQLVSGTPVGAADTYSVRVTATDPEGATAIDEFNLEVAATNSAPVLAMGKEVADLFVAPGRADLEISLERMFTDADDDILRVTAALLDSSGTPGALPAWLALGGTRIGKPADIDAALTAAVVGPEERTYRIRVTATDPDGASASDEFDLVVVDNAAPVVANEIGDRAVAPGTADFVISLANVFSDGDGDNLTITAIAKNGDIPANLPDWLVFNGDPDGNPATLDATLTAATVGDAGMHTIRVTANDGRGGKVDDEFTLLVASLHAADDTLIVVEGDVSGTVNVIQGAGAGNDGQDSDLTRTGDLQAELKVVSFWPGSDTASVPAGAVFAGQSDSAVGEYGRLSVDEDGSAVYTLLPEASELADSAVDEFAYEITNGSGSITARARLTVTVNAVDHELAVKNAIGWRVFRPTGAEGSPGRQLSIEIPEDAFVDPDTPDPVLTLSVSVIDRGTTVGDPPAERELGLVENPDLSPELRWLRFDPAAPGTISGAVPESYRGGIIRFIVEADSSSGDAHFTFGLVVTGVQQAPVPVGTQAISSASWSIIDAIRQGLRGSLEEESSQFAFAFAFAASGGQRPGLAIDVAPMAAFFSEAGRGPKWQADDSGSHRASAAAQAGSDAPVGGLDGISEGRAFGFGEIVNGSGRNSAVADSGSFGSSAQDAQGAQGAQGARGARGAGSTRSARIWANARRDALRDSELDMASAAGFRPESDEQETFGLGFDASLGDGVSVGLALARHVGKTGFAGMSATGEAGNVSETVQTTVAPYVAVAGERYRHWGAVGLGQGELSFAGAVPTGFGTTMDVEDSSDIALRLAAFGSDYDLAPSRRIQATGRVEVISATMTLGEARDATYARQDAYLHGVRGEFDVGMPVSAGIAQIGIEPRASLGYRWESGEVVYGDLAGTPGSAVSLDARTYEYGGGVSLGLRDLSMDVAYMTRPTGSGDGDGYSLEAIWDRGRDGSGVMASLNAGVGTGTSRSMDPFSASALQSGSTTGSDSASDERATATARVGYGVDTGRFGTLSAYAESGYRAGALDRMAFGVGRSGALATLGLSCKASLADADSDSGSRSVALDARWRF